MRKHADGIFGNREKREDGKDRAFVEKVVCKLLKIYFGIKMPDANAPFRLMNTDVVAKYLDKLPKDYNLPNIMLVVYYLYYSERTIFHEISFKAREKGKNSINIPRIIRIGCRALIDFAVLRKGMKDDE